MNELPTPPSSGVRNRLFDWDYRLNELLIEVAQRPFQWGQWDCCIFAGSVIQALTGKNPATQYIGTYHDKKTAAKQMQQVGASRVEEILTELGFSQIPLQLAQRGDLVYHRINNALGVSKGIYSSFIHDCGTIDIRTLDCDKAWAI